MTVRIYTYKCLKCGESWVEKELVEQTMITETSWHKCKDGGKSIGNLVGYTLIYKKE